MKTPYKQTSAIMAVLFLFLTSKPNAEEALNSVRWLTDEQPFYHLKGHHGQFPFRIAGKSAGYLVLVPERESPNVGGAFLSRNGVEKPIETPDNGTIGQVGFIELKPGTDFILLRAWGMGNGGLFDESLMCVDPATNISVWLRDDNIAGPPRHTVSSNYYSPESKPQRKVLEDLRIKLFPKDIPRRRGA